LLTLGALAVSIHSANLAREGVAIATQSFIQAKKQWEKDNTPELQLGNIVVNPLTVGQPIIIQFIISNFGKQSAKIVSITGTVVYSNVPAMNDFSYLPKEATPINIALRGGTNFPLSLVSNVPLPQHQKDSITSGKLDLFLMGKATYINTINDSTKTYIFNWRISLYPQIHFAFITDSQ
jgi:hypothetical protein